MTAFRTLDDMGDIAGKRVLVRVDLNVPMIDGWSGHGHDPVAGDGAHGQRTWQSGGPKCSSSHILGVPKGAKNPNMSVLSLVIDAVAETLGRSVMFISDCVGDRRVSWRCCARPRRCRGARKYTLPWPVRKSNDPALADAIRQRLATFMSTTLSPPRTARMPLPKDWRTGCLPLPAARWKQS